MHDDVIHIVDLPISIENEELLPAYMTQGSAGADIKAHLQEPIVLMPGQSCMVPTGMSLAIPLGYEIQIRPRSGLALKYITVLNTPGTIDSDYRGEIKVILINHGKESFTITPGMRIAQMILAPVVRANFVIKHELAATGRGNGGFGHTGH